MLKHRFIGFLFLLTSLLIFVIYAGRFLAKESPLEKADVVLHFLGGIQYKEVPKYIQDGWAEKIVFSTTRSYSKPIIDFKGENLYASAAFVVSHNRKVGINDSSIIVLKGNVINTADEAFAFVKYLKQNPQIKKCLVVSGAYHMRRISLTLNWFCKKEGINVKFIYRPAYDKIYKPVGWWRNVINKNFVLNEYLKIFNFLFIDKYGFY